MAYRQKNQPVLGGLDDDEDDDDSTGSPEYVLREDYSSGLHSMCRDSPNSETSSITCSIEDLEDVLDYQDSLRRELDYNNNNHQSYRGSINALGYHEDEEESAAAGAHVVRVNALGYHLDEPEPSYASGSLNDFARRGSGGGRRSTAGRRSVDTGGGGRHSTTGRRSVETGGGGRHSTTGRRSVETGGGRHSTGRRSSVEGGGKRRGGFGWGRRESTGPPKEIAWVKRAPRRMSTAGRIQGSSSSSAVAAGGKTSTGTKKSHKNSSNGNRRGSLLGLMPVPTLPTLPALPNITTSIFKRDNPDCTPKEKKEARMLKQLVDELHRI